MENKTLKKLKTAWENLKKIIEWLDKFFVTQNLEAIKDEEVQ